MAGPPGRGALEEPRPQAGNERHGGVGWKLVLNASVPQGYQEAETALPAFLKRMEEEKVKKVEEKRMLQINDKIRAYIPVSSTERADWRRWAGLDEPSSSSGGTRRKRKKRRKKKLPKTRSSSFLLMASERDQDAGKMLEYVQRADEFGYTPRMHAEFLKAIHSKEDAGYTGEMDNFIEEKVIIGNTGEEIILKNRQPAFSLYRDRTHLYTCCWLDWLKKRHRYV